MNTLCLFEVSDSVVSNVPLCFVCSSEGRKEALPPIGSVMATVGRMVLLDFDVCMWEERAEFRLVRLFLVDCVKSWTNQHWIPCVSNLSKTKYLYEEVLVSCLGAVSGRRFEMSTSFSLSWENLAKKVY